MSELERTHNKRWSRKYDRCQCCGKTDSKHKGGGKCISCYYKKYREANPEILNAARKKWYSKNKGQARAYNAKKKYNKVNNYKEAILKGEYSDR